MDSIHLIIVIHVALCYLKLNFKNSYCRKAILSLSCKLRILKKNIQAKLKVLCFKPNFQDRNSFTSLVRWMVTSHLSVKLYPFGEFPMISRVNHLNFPQFFLYLGKV